MFEEIRERVFAANIRLIEFGLVTLTWGNVSEVDRKAGIFAIKPSGVDYKTMRPADIVVISLDGCVVDGRLKPSSDTPTHLRLYRAWDGLGGVVHTHSSYATSWAQAGSDIPAFGTTHADAFHGAVPCTPPLSNDEIESDYEINTGAAIIKTFDKLGIDYSAVPAVLVGSHGPFAWGADASKAVENAVTLEEVAKTAMLTLSISPNTKEVGRFLLDKHYFRKHGVNAYYGQSKT